MGKPILLKGAKVVDAQGERSADVLVRDGRIDGVGDVPGGDHEVVAAQGRWLTPGLIDCHVHLVLEAGPDPSIVPRYTEAQLAVMALGHAQATLKGGVTTARDTGGYRFAEVAVRDGIRKGLAQGPRLLVSGHVLTPTGGHGHFIGREADGPVELLKAAREQLKGGVDWLKVIATGGVLTPSVDIQAAQWSTEEIASVVEQARKYGKRVAAHAHGAGGIEAAVKGGVASIEHGTYLSDPLAMEMARRGTYLVPTAAALKGILGEGAGKGIPEDAVRRAKDAERSHKESVQRAMAKGVPIAMGTDAGTPFNRHGENPQEVAHLVEYGLKPAQALAAATTHAAKLLGLEHEVGLVKAGFAADLLLLDRNPLDDPWAFRKGLLRVMRGGAWVG